MKLNRITSIQQDNNYKRNCFRSNSNILIRNGIEYKQKTSFFRDDLEWAEFGRFIEAWFKNIQKVNILNLACSDGSEPWSLAILLIEKFQSDAKKFFPIKASDFDKNIIEQAQNFPCGLSVSDLYQINKYTKDHFYDYFKMVMRQDDTLPMAVRPKENLSKNVEFHTASAIEELNSITSKNNIIMCRNFWKYLTEQERIALVQKLAEKLDKTSLVVIGELENGHKYNKLLNAQGFHQTKITNVYTKE